MNKCAMPTTKWRPFGPETKQVEYGVQQVRTWMKVGKICNYAQVCMCTDFLLNCSGFRGKMLRNAELEVEPLPMSQPAAAHEQAATGSSLPTMMDASPSIPRQIAAVAVATSVSTSTSQPAAAELEPAESMDHFVFTTVAFH
jgi:hypothetical protein